jgi:hypothetical protein
VALGGVGYASIPGPDGRFHACYADAGGAMRIVDSDVACEERETRITFNQSGPTGPAGPTSEVNGPVIGALISTIAAVRTLVAQTQTNNTEDQAELKKLKSQLKKQEKKLKRLLRCPECIRQ